MKAMADNGNGKKVVVQLSFPNIDKVFPYTYASDMERSHAREAMREWYEEYADKLFALYPYGPMNVSVSVDGHETWFVKACYQETLWHAFFREGGDPWCGRFPQFVTALMQFRSREERREQPKAA